MEVSSLPRPGSGFLPRSKRVLATLGDERLVDQLRRGNDVAFEVMYDRHHRAILSFCRHMLSSQEEAEDAVQHTFISAHSDLVGSDKPIRLKPWLFTIARNRCLSILRARREEAAELDDIPTAGLTHQVQHRDDLRRMLADLHELPEDQRAALVLSELGDLSHAEIAGIVGCETLKVKSLVFQARSSLIESRHAREIPCQEIREQLATLRGGALRRGTLRKHVSSCAGCSEFREEVRRQRTAMAALLPVLPSAGLKNGVLAAVGFGGGAAGGGALGAAGTAGVVAGGGAVAGGSAGIGGVIASLAGAGVTKVAVAAVVATGAVASGAVVVDQATTDDPRDSGFVRMPHRDPGDVARGSGLTSLGVATPTGEVATAEKKAKEHPPAGSFRGDEAVASNPASADDAAHARNDARHEARGDRGSSSAARSEDGNPGNSGRTPAAQRRERGNNANRAGKRPRPARPPQAASPAPPAATPATPAPAQPPPSQGVPARDPKGTRGDRGRGPRVPEIELPLPK